MTAKNRRAVIYCNPTTPFGVARKICIQLAKIGVCTSRIHRGTNAIIAAYDIRCGRVPGPTFAVLLPLLEDAKSKRRWEKFRETHESLTEKEVQKFVHLEFLGSIRVLPSLEVLAEGEGHGVIDRTAQIQSLLEEARLA
jgi:hypothetical protein